MTMTNSFTERKPLFPGKACYPLSPPKTSDMNYKKINDFPHSVYDQLYLYIHSALSSSVLLELLPISTLFLMNEHGTTSNPLEYVNASLFLNYLSSSLLRLTTSYNAP